MLSIGGTAAVAKNNHFPAVIKGPNKGGDYSLYDIRPSN
jgi:hypothetical protein